MLRGAPRVTLHLLDCGVGSPLFQQELALESHHPSDAHAIQITQTPTPSLESWQELWGAPSDGATDMFTATSLKGTATPEGKSRILRMAMAVAKQKDGLARTSSSGHRTIHNNCDCVEPTQARAQRRNESTEPVSEKHVFGRTRQVGHISSV